MKVLPLWLFLLYLKVLGIFVAELNKCLSFPQIVCQPSFDVVSRTSRSSIQWLIISNISNRRGDIEGVYNRAEFGSSLFEASLDLVGDATEDSDEWMKFD